VHKKCSGLKRLVDDPNFRCTRCQGLARPIDGRQQTKNAGGNRRVGGRSLFLRGCELATSSANSSPYYAYSTYIRSVILHGSETWPLTNVDLQCLQRNDRAMIRQICGVKPKEVANVRSKDLLDKLGLLDLDNVLRENRLRWYGHVQRSNGAIKTAYDFKVIGKRGRGRPKMTWSQLIKKDCSAWGLSTSDPKDRKVWKEVTKTAMRAASQMPGREVPEQGRCSRTAR
jgi:hypothetical protein